MGRDKNDNINTTQNFHSGINNEEIHSYKSLFEDCPVPIWDEDFSLIKKYLDELKSEGVTDFDSFFKSNPKALFECASLLIVNDVNQAVVDLNEADSKEHMLQNFRDLITEKSPDYALEQFIAIANNRTSCEFDAELITFSGVKRHVNLKWTVAKGFESNYKKVFLTTTDVTQRIIAENLLLQNSNKQKELLLKEIHHRVKNNLQIIISLLNLQISSIDDKNIKSIFELSLHRINSMALVHDLLYKSKDFSQINYGKYLETLIHPLIASMNPTSNPIELKMDVQNISLNINTSIPLGLLINEIITNSLKHAFDHDQKGEIYLRLHSVGYPNFRMCIGDNGKGYDPEFNLESANSLGLQLISGLSEQLSGTVERDTSQKGSHYCITFEELPTSS